MLPSKGYFKSFNCPFYENRKCERPHCHYRHTRREKPDFHNDEMSQENKSIIEGKNEKITARSFSEAVEKILREGYLSTTNEKDESSVLKNSIISKVCNNLASTPSPTYPNISEVPSYKPTPISELKKRHIPVAYAPNIVRSVVPKSKSSVKKAKIEYVPQSENGTEPTLPVSYSPTPSNQITKDRTQEYLPAGSNWNHSYTPSKILGSHLSNEDSRSLESSAYMLSPVYTSSTKDHGEYHVPDNDIRLSYENNNVDKGDSSLDTDYQVANDENDDDDLDLDDISPELDMLGQIVDADMQDSDEDHSSSKNERASTDVIIQGEKIETYETGDVHVNDTSENVSEIKSVNHTEKGSDTQSDQPKYHGSKHKSKSKSHSSSKSSDRRSSSSSSKSHEKSSGKSNHGRKRHHSSSSSSPSKEKSKSHSSSSSKSKSSHDSKSKHKSSSRHKYSSSSSSKHKKDKQSADENLAANCNSSGGSKHKNEKSSHKSKNSGSHSSKTSHSSSKNNSKSERKRKSSSDYHSTRDTKKKKKEEAELVASSSSNSDVEEVIPPTDIVVIDSDSDNDVRLVNKCDASDDDNHYEDNEDFSDNDMSDENFEMNNFVEKGPESAKQSESLPEVKEKRRISHCSAPVSRQVYPADAQKIISQPGKALIDRWHKVNSSLETEKASVGEDNAANKVPTAPGPKVRIAHVPNVNSLLNAKKTLLMGSRQTSVVSRPFPNAKSYSTATSTASGSAGKPVNPPLVMPVENTKIPVVKRQIHLNKIFEICLMIYNIEVAKLKAAQIEKEICEASKSLMTYTNKVLQSIVGLKKEVKILTGEASAVPSKSEDSSETHLSVYDCLQKFLLPIELYQENSIPIKIDDKPGCAFIDKDSLPGRLKQRLSFCEGTDKYPCLNCGQMFQVNEAGYSIEKKCRFHPASRCKIKTGKCGRVKYYECCNGDEASSGCTVNEYHVRETLNYDCMPGFRETMPAPPNVSPANYGVYAIDCEMCYTTFGHELVRVTVINEDKEIKYDRLVKPKNPIIDYCTRFSGITEAQMKHITKTLLDVQNDLMKFIYAETVLIGHGIGSDLKVLRLLHYNIVDTTHVYPHKNGPPFKRRLAEITKEFLNRMIQESEDGHDSKEDAVACMDLMLLKVKDVRKASQPRKIIGYSGKK